MEFKTIYWKEDEWVMAKVLGYEGTTVQTNSIDEANEILQDAMIDFIKARINQNKPVKQNYTFDEMLKVTEQYKKNKYIIGFIKVDEKLADENYYKTVRTNVSVINGYKAAAKKEGLNLSKLLNDALKVRFG